MTTRSPTRNGAVLTAHNVLIALPSVRSFVTATAELGRYRCGILLRSNICVHPEPLVAAYTFALPAAFISHG